MAVRGASFRAVTGEAASRLFLREGLMHQSGATGPAQAMGLPHNSYGKLPVAKNYVALGGFACQAQAEGVQFHDILRQGPARETPGSFLSLRAPRPNSTQQKKPGGISAARLFLTRYA